MFILTVVNHYNENQETYSACSTLGLKDFVKEYVWKTVKNNYESQEEWLEEDENNELLLFLTRWKGEAFSFHCYPYTFSVKV